MTCGEDWVIGCSGEGNGQCSTEVVFWGDVALAGEVGDAIRRHGTEFIFQKMSPGHFQADIVCFNLESCLSSRGSVWEPKPVHFRGDPAFLSVFPDSRCQYVANVSNNHFLDYGEDAAADTLEALSAHGMDYFGAVGTAVETPRSRVLKTCSGKVGLIGFAPSAHALPGERHVNLPVDNATTMISAVRQLKDQADVVVVSLHQGVEHVRAVERQCRQRAHMCVDAGADCIICHHPHVIQGMEVHKGVPVFYSLGNLVIGLDFHERPAARESLALRLRITNKKLVSVTVEPFVIGDSLQPRPATKEEKDRIRAETESLSRVFNSSVRTHAQYIKCRGLKAWDQISSLCEMIQVKGVVSTARYYCHRIRSVSRRRREAD